jgi:hypothetical protein
MNTSKTRLGILSVRSVLLWMAAKQAMKIEEAVKKDLSCSWKF